MLDGPQAGASTVTDAKGLFKFSGRFASDITLRASLEGFVTTTKTLSLADGTSSEGLISFDLQPNQPSVHLDLGPYDLTVVAASSCTGVPENMRTVSFPATIATATFRPLETFYLVSLTDSFPGSLGFGLGVAGNRLGFEIDGPVPVKSIPPSTYIEVEGTAGMSPATLTPSTISIPFSGLYDYCVLKTPMPSNRWTTCHILPADTIVQHVECLGNHQMVLTKR